jgi:acyl-CoA thioester hydrolase
MMPRLVAVDEIRIEVELRWRDLDYLGHLNQAVYHELLEEGRGALFERLGVMETGFFFVLARVELDHRHEVRRDHSPVAVVLRVEAVGRSSVTVRHEIVLPDGTVAAEGRSVLVAWDREQRRSRPLEESERVRLGTDLAQEVDERPGGAPEGA